MVILSDTLAAPSEPVAWLYSPPDDGMCHPEAWCSLTRKIPAHNWTETPLYRTGQLVPVPSVERVALLERLEASTESMERTLAAMDRYNEKNGTAIIGPSLLTLGKMIAANRAVIAAMKEGRADG